MDNITYFSKDGKFSLKKNLQESHASILPFDDIKKLLTHLINVPETPYLLFEPSNLADDHKFLEAIFNLNRMLPIIFLCNQHSCEAENIIKQYSTIQICKNFTEFEELVTKIDQNPRKSNRVNWPLTAKFFKDPQRPVMGKGNITSLSIGGLFIKTQNLEDVDLEDKLFFDIVFMDFTFLVEGVVITITPAKDSNNNIGGFAVRFENISDPTKKYISNLINHKLLNMLINDL